MQTLLNQNISKLNITSFRLMHSYPDTSYLPVLEKFFMMAFVRSVCRDYHDFSDPPALNCLASYKEPRSAEMLSKLWHMKTPNDCSNKWNQMKDYLLDAIWDNKCDSYSQLLKSTASAKKLRDKSIVELDMPAQKGPENQAKDKMAMVEDHRK